MKTRYLNTDQFRKEVANTKGTSGPIEVVPKADERLVLLASAVPEIRAIGEKDSGLVEFVITDESVDRMSDVIKLDGWDVKDFLNNPVVLWAHSHFDVPVGKAITLDILTAQKQIRSVTQFTPRDLSEFGYMVYQMYVQRFLNAVSVGFQPKEYTWVSSDTDEERARRGGIDFLKQSLLEYSTVPVPANPNALAVARSAGIDTAPMKAWAERVLDDGNADAAAKGYLEVLRTAASPKGRTLFLDVSDIKAVQDVPAEPKVTKLAKKVVTERWECGTDGHNHTTEAEAEQCAQDVKALDTAGDALATLTAALVTATKAGRVLSKKNEDALRAAVEALQGVLAQLDAQEEGDDDKGKKGPQGVIRMNLPDVPAEPKQQVLIKIDGDASTIHAAVTKAVKDALARLGGRVD